MNPNRCEQHWFAANCYCNPAFPVSTSHEQHDVDYTLSIMGPDYAGRGVADFIVDAAGEAVDKMIKEVLAEAAAKIADNLGENYTVTFR